MNEQISVVAGIPSVSTGDPRIEWSPIAQAHRLRFSGTSQAVLSVALQEAFGKFPVRLTGGNHLLMLKAMCAAAGEGKQPYVELIEALSKFGQLEVVEVR